MQRKSNGLFSEDKTEPGTERSLFSRIAEAVIVFAICCFLVKLGVGYILSVKVPLIVITAIVAIIVISYRAWRWRKHHDDY